MSWDPPPELEEYRIVRALGAGAMGLVFLAHDTLLDRPVAIKFISALEVGATARERFFTEARAVARLSHPNVVAVHRVGEVHHRPYLVSEYVRGTSLAELPKPVPWERALKIAIGLARGLGAAHRAGVLHRDIKPANVMIGEDDEAKLLDFGLAKLVSAGALLEREPVSARLPSRGIAGTHEVDATISMAPSSSPVERSARPVERCASPLGRSAPPLGLLPISHTQEGAILGTPLYLAPERWIGAPASQASDVYALGIVLYELLVGTPPHAGMTLPELAARVPAEAVAGVASQVGDLPTRLAELIDACVAREPARRPASGDALCDLLETVLPRPAPLVAGSPYRGLSTFESEHRAMFFGRAAEARAVVERLRTETLVIVAGDSGAGKSSLCRAAVLPAVAEKSLAGKRWRVTAIVPGVRPLARLEAALADRRPDEGLLVFIDQLEELLTLAEPEEAARVAERLAELVVASSSVRVVASARSDYLGRLAGLPGLGELVGRALFLLAPLKDQGLLDAIQGPARAAGYTFEAAETVDELVASGRGHLPLLQFALSELWDARDQVRKVIPADALARIGGVAGALARHADQVLAGLPPLERRAARAILLSLVTAETTRARRSHADVIERGLQASPRAEAALDALVRGRLLIVQEAESGEQSEYTIAHEALLRGWATLRHWLEHDAQGRSARQRVDRAAEAWEQLGRPAHALWNPQQLREVAGIDLQALPARDAAFVAAGRRLAARRRRRQWAIAIGVAVTAAGAVAGVQAQAAHARGVVADLARLELAQARLARARVEGERQDAFARFDAGDTAVAERRWRDARAEAPAVEQAYASVAARLERLLQDDPGDAAVRGLLSDVLLERAELADGDGRTFERDDLVRRLGVYGASARWSAPARLSIETRAGATVQLRRYERAGDRWSLSAPVVLGETPLPAQQLAPGSVLLEIAAPGRADVRVPVVLARGGDEHVAVALPRGADVPDGFVVVPGGAFLYGSVDDGARATYDSEPRHRVRVAPFLIARDETTFGDWIGFLRGLPPGERAARLPRVRREGFTVELTEQADHGYRLALGPDDHVYSAREGEPIVYQGRDRRARQDWSRLPVTAISFEDLVAYTAWLRTIGRVPGARPCTEQEWELAARGADGRAFPAGERLEADDANHDLTYGRVMAAFGPDEVGSHLASDSPFGVHDLAGNVWEWTASRDPDHPVARGGGFFQAAAFARPENRAVDVPGRRDAFYGARVCAPLTADRD